MAFLDNSGDIILDAVLTELGRKKMSTGNFKISKFGLGDDEINYALYNKNHASGSAYYDLEIMQTPIFEASTAINASINYGLTSRKRNLLYMPALKRNQKIESAAKPVSNVYYLAVNDGKTADALVAAFGGVTGGGQQKVIRSGRVDGTCLIFESGLDTDEISATSANKSAYLSANGLQEAEFNVSVDRRFFAAVLGPSQGSRFDNSGQSGEPRTKFRLKPYPLSKGSKSMKRQIMAAVPAINNGVIKRLTDNTPDTSTSVIKGPRGSVLALGFQLKMLPVSLFTKFGKTGQSISGAAGTYRYIDTTVKVFGATGTQDQLPIRIIQKE